MARSTLSFDQVWTKPIRSTVKFAGKYKEELEKLIEMLDESFEQASWLPFTIDSVMSARNNIRLRISEPELGAEMIVNCVFWYHHEDERYGYINIDLVTSGLSRKGETRFVGAFNITDRAKIKDKVWRHLMGTVKF